MSVVNRRAETKCQFITNSTDDPVYSNYVSLLTDNVCRTALGTRGEKIGSPTSLGTRIGNTIFAKGVRIAIMFQNLPKRPNVTYYLALMRNKTSGKVTLGAIDVTLQDKADIFEGVNTRIPLDYIDTSKVQVKWLRKIRVVQRGIGSTISADAEGKISMEEDGPDDDTGTAEYAGESKAVITAPNVVKKFYIPFNHKIMYPDYDDGATPSEVPMRPNQWQLVLWAYDSSLVPGGGKVVANQVGNVTCSTKFFYTDV